MLSSSLLDPETTTAPSGALRAPAGAVAMPAGGLVDGLVEGGPGGDPGGPLGTSLTEFPPLRPAKTASTSANVNARRRRTRFARRLRSAEWLVREARVAAGHSPVAAPGTTSKSPDWVRPPRAARCRWAMGDVGVHGDASGAHYSGLERCASIWACPVCSAVIRAGRAEEIADAVGRWEAAGGHVVMATLTVRHRAGDGLAEALDGVLRAWQQTISSSPWLRAKERYRIAGYVRSVEVTHGANGWHPHVHALLFIQGAPWTDAEASAFESWFFDRWLAKTTAQGLRQPSRAHGIDLVHADGGRVLAEYLAKTQEHEEPRRSASVGNEMARTDMKSGRGGSLMPFELLDSEPSDREAAALWNEYVAATHGRRAVTWSRGLRDLVAAGEERSDEEIIDETEARPMVFLLPRETYTTRLANAPDVLALVLERVEAGQGERVRRLLGGLPPVGVPPA